MEKNKQIIGLTCGTFDLFHQGHVNILHNSKNYCDKLIVALSTDELVEEYKEKPTILKYDNRKLILESCKYVDIVIPQYELDKTKLIDKLNVDYIFVGDDWYGTSSWKKLNDQLKIINHKCQIVYFPYTSDISTTKVKEKIRNG